MTNKPSTILIVDDDRTVIEQLTTHFRRRNFEPIATANPAIVEQTLDAFEVQLILLDLRMERVNGYDVLRKLRDRQCSVPVLIITAYYSDEKERLKAAGISAEEVIEKPFRDFSKIEQKINQKLNRVALPDEVGSDYEDEIYYDNRTRVVIVDDEPEITELLAEFLRERQYQVECFQDGQICLDFLKQHAGEYQIGIIDMAIPGVPGDRLIQEGKTLCPAMKFIPISAKYAEEIKVRLKQIGFNPHELITKPFDVPGLIEKIKVMAIEAGTLGKS